MMEQRGILLVGKKLILLILLTGIINATEYLAKIEPYEKHIISSQVDGKVDFLDKTKEHSFIKTNTPIVKLDTTDEKTQIDSLKNSIKLQKSIVAIKEDNYNNKAKVKQLSIYNKNQEKLYLFEAKQTLENLHKNLNEQKNIVDKKTFNLENTYLDKIFISKNEYVTTGTKLFSTYDFSKLKLEIFVREKEIATLKNKKIFIDGKQSQFSLEKISQVRDEKRVSTYRVVLSKQNLDRNIYFGKLVKVEFK